ncbi:hypothetical protein [Pseudomonas sp. W5-36]|uniref:hypothetical protein n=1 Tax=Pseudomonas sp. W5-36 TaxID=3097455 RepID=UPI00397BFA5E
MIFEKILPVTVIAALALFLIKEVIEFFKRRAERQRKITAYKLLLLEELRKNAWTVSSLKDMCSLISHPKLTEISYYKSSAGSEKIRFHISTLPETNTLWPVHTAVFEKLYVGLAEIDQDLFKDVSELYEKLAEVKHVRDHFINFSEDDEIKPFIKGLHSYGTDRLEECEIAMDSLCLRITGKPLSERKLRSYV